MAATTGTEYSVATKYATILASDLDGPTAAAKQMGVPVRTVRAWNSKREELGVPEGVALSIVKERFENKVDSIMADCLEIIEKASAQVKKKIGEASAAQAATIMGIYTDKALLLNGLTGSKGAGPNTSMTEEQRQRMILDAADVITKGMAIEVESEVVE